MSEEKVNETVVSRQDVEYGVGTVREARPRKSSTVDPAAIAGEIFDERYETTQRGLKSRYVFTLAFLQSPQ
jgi:amino acid transporter